LQIAALFPKKSHPRNSDTFLKANNPCENSGRSGKDGADARKEISGIESGCHSKTDVWHKEVNLAEEYQDEGTAVKFETRDDNIRLKWKQWSQKGEMNATKKIIKNSVDND
jgi:hypothetical protein